VKLVGAGSTLLFPVGHQHVPHLILVLTDPAGPSDIVVVTAVVSEKSFTDKTVTLNVGDHPFIRWPSNVDYGWSRFVPAKRLLRGTPQEELSDAILARVRAGLLASSHTANELVSYCRPIFEPIDEES
jgi:hypothetical protein